MLLMKKYGSLAELIEDEVFAAMEPRERIMAACEVTVEQVGGFVMAGSTADKALELYCGMGGATLKLTVQQTK